MPTPTFTKADCELLARFDARRTSWDRVDESAKRKLANLRKRVDTVLSALRARYPGTIAVKKFVAPIAPADITASECWACIYPASVPNKSFGLQLAFAVTPRGAELCLAVGSDRRRVRDPEVAALNRHAVEEMQQLLSDLPAEFLQALETTVQTEGWRLRTTWRNTARGTSRRERTPVFDSVAEWVQYAASPRGERANIAQTFTPRTLERLGSGILDRALEMAARFAPLLDYVYAPDDDANETQAANGIVEQDPFADARAMGRSFGGSLRDRVALDEGLAWSSTNHVAEEGPAYGASGARSDRMNAGDWSRTVRRHRHDQLPPPEPFDLDAAAADLFITRDIVARALDLLATRQNVILEGPPGVGKTFIARRLAFALLGETDHARLETVQFHQSYAYEDFVQGWRPAAGGGFVLRNGVFYEFCRAAAQDTERPYVFVIEEINRANVSSVFGELLLLLERDKRTSACAIPLTYATSASDRFYVPPNVHLIGTMNTADRSLALVDVALRRRFAFVRLAPAFGSEAGTKAFVEYLKRHRIPVALARRIAARMQALNTEIIEDRKRLGPGFEVGHSFFVPREPVSTTPPPTRFTRADADAWYATIVESEIEPLLREYWYDDPGRVADAVEQLLAP